MDFTAPHFSIQQFDQNKSILTLLFDFKKKSRPKDTIHTRSSWADFNHGLVVQCTSTGVSKNLQKYFTNKSVEILRYNLANVEGTSKILQKPSKMTDFW